MSPFSQRPRPTPQRSLERARINFGWLLKLRFAAFAGQLAVILFVQFWLGIELPLYALSVILAFEAISNVVLSGWFRSEFKRARDDEDSERVIRRVLGLVLLLDVALLTTLLWLTGGSNNPFAEFYLVHIVLAGAVLGARWTALVTAFAVLGYAIVYHTHQPLIGISDLGGESWAALLFRRGLGVAFVASSAVIAVFLARVTSEIEALEHKLDDSELRKARAERMEALGTLAAGAAHELASPLSTIAVTAKDLETVLASHSVDAAADARLIRDEVKRCREILDQMAIDAGQMTGAELVATDIDELLEATILNLKRAQQVSISIAPSLKARRLLAPKRALALALRQVVKNALDASPLEKHVDVDVTIERGMIGFEVYDRGSGMTAATIARATDPFFTTKEPGQGMGLGLFLAQTVIERLDGRMQFDSEPGLGTTVRVEIPLARLEPKQAPERGGHG